MSAEGNPLTDHSLLARSLASLVDLTLARPKTTVFLAAVLSVAACLYSWQYLGFRSNRAELLDPNVHFNKLWLEYVDEFGDADDAVVFVEGSGAATVTPVLDEIANRLAGDERSFSAVMRGVDLSRVRAKGLHFLPLDELARIDRFTQQTQPLVDGQWNQLQLGEQASRLGQLAAHPEALGDPQVRAQLAEAQARLPQMIAGLHATLVEREGYKSPYPALGGNLEKLAGAAAQEYLLANDGRFGFVVLHVAGNDNQFARGSEAIDALRAVLAEVRARHPEVSVGLTGLPVMENDEMRTSAWDMNMANAVSLVAVMALYYAGFGGIRHSLLGMGALMCGMAWSMGFAALAVGHLNILSAAFGVVLIGLGIDFPMHLASHYIEVRGRCNSTRAALLEATRLVGPGILTGGAAVALTFFSTAMTHFKGVAELGIISGGGILLCIVAALFVTPAVILLADRNRPASRLPQLLNLAPTLKITYTYPRAVIVGVLALAVVATCGLFNLRYDHNLLNLQPLGLESVELEHRLLEESDKSSWHALSIAATPAEALARKQKFLALPSVERVDDIASLLPPADAQKQALIAGLQRRLAHLPERPPVIPVDAPEQLSQGLAAAQNLFLAGDNTTRVIREQLEQVREALRTLPREESLRRMSEYQQALATDVLTRLHLLQSLANPEPPTLADLPPALVTRFVGRSGKHLLRIYAKGNIWDRDALGRFVNDIQQVDPAVTGHPIQAFYASAQMQEGYLQAGIYSLLIVAMTLMLDFRSIRCVLLALVPLALGMGETFGILGWLNIPLNPANLIALPLIIGLGLDSGVLLIHDYMHQRGAYRLGNSLLNSVLLAALTTTGSFGALLFSNHQGLRTQGQVLCIGVTCCFLTSVLFLPAAFAWLERRRKRDVPVAAPDTAAHAPLERHVRRTTRRVRLARAAAGGVSPELPPAGREPTAE